MTSRFSELPARLTFFIASLGEVAQSCEEQGGVAFANETLDKRGDIGGSVVHIGQKDDRSRRIVLPYLPGNVGGRNIWGEAVIEKHGVDGFIWGEFEAAHRHKNGQASEAGRFHDHSIDLEMRGVVVDEQDGNLLIHRTSASRGIGWDTSQYHNPYELFMRILAGYCGPCRGLIMGSWGTGTQWVETVCAG